VACDCCQFVRTFRLIGLVPLISGCLCGLRVFAWFTCWTFVDSENACLRCLLPVLYVVLPLYLLFICSTLPFLRVSACTSSSMRHLVCCTNYFPTRCIPLLPTIFFTMVVVCLPCSSRRRTRVWRTPWYASHWLLAAVEHSDISTACYLQAGLPFHSPVRVPFVL